MEVADAALTRVEISARTSARGIPGPAGYAVACEMSVPIPEAPLEGGIPRILKLLDRAVEAALDTTHPGYLAYIPGGGIFASALADFYANCVNRYTGLSLAAPALCQLEAVVLAWLAEQFGYDHRARGLFTSGGSLANFSAIVAARHAHFGEDGDLGGAVVYASAEAHHSIVKDAYLAGIRQRNVREIPVDMRLRMRSDKLREQILKDRRAGLKPFLVVSSCGTTNVGAIDPLREITAICHEEALWHHVDAAYGGAFVLCPEGARRLDGIGEADSITFDPHKGMFLPYGIGCLLAANGEALRAAHVTDASYLQKSGIDVEKGPPSPDEYGPELTRSFRGLRVWLPLMLHGADAFRSALTEKLALAARLHEGLLRLIDGGVPLEIVTEPELSVVAFRLRRDAGETIEAWDRRNERLLDALNRRGRVVLSSTRVPVEHVGRALALRACVLSYRTHAPQVDACIEDLSAILMR